MKIYNGRPTDIDEREEREKQVYDLLEDCGITYQCADHEPAFTMEACKEVDEALGVSMCKNLFLCNRNKTKFYLLLMPGEKPFKTKDLRGQHDIQRLSFASDEYMLEFLDIQPGAVSVLGLMNDGDNRVQLLVDKDILEEEDFGCHPCVNTSSLKFRTTDVMEKLLPAIHHEKLVVELPWNIVE